MWSIDAPRPGRRDRLAGGSLAVCPSLPGWIYCGAVLLGWCASLWIAPHSQTGWIASAGFLALGAAWIAATGLAVRFILRGDALSHRRWMIRSFALTAAAITLRMYLPLVFVFHWPFSIAYPATAWLCWIPNALAAEAYLRFVPTPARLVLPAGLAGSSPESFGTQKARMTGGVRARRWEKRRTRD